MVPDQYCAEGIVSLLKDSVLPGEKILLPRAGGARMLLPEDLKLLGAVVEEINLYEAAVPDRVDENALKKIFSGETDFITFTSSSTVINFIHLVGEKYPGRFDSKTKVACIGPITADTARKNGFRVDIVAETYTTEGLLEAMVEDTLKNVPFTDLHSQ
jgi:uroporphyrinogen III methyltransferase/synthase